MKTVLITGGAKRLGRALVEYYAAAGWRVMFTCQWSIEEAGQLANELGDNVRFLRTAVSTRSDGALVKSWIERDAGQLDLLICSASSFKRLSVEDTTPDDFKNLLESNLVGPFFLIQQCLPLLRAAGGAVVNIGDAQVGSGAPNFSAYLAAKAGLVSITQSLAVELAPAVRVNAVMPGTLQWPVNDAAYPEAERAEILRRIPMSKVGEWSDVVGAVAYLAEAPYVTGCCLPVDGGRSANK